MVASLRLQSNAAEAVAMDFFGVYDGHGGKQAATFASRHLLEKLQAALQTAQQQPGSASQDEMPPELQDCPHLTPEDWAAWSSQEHLVCALPQAFAAAFRELQADFFHSTKVTFRPLQSASLIPFSALALERLDAGNICMCDVGRRVLELKGWGCVVQESGTTATAAVLAGWDLIVANVGDSCAFLDTGSEVLQVTAAFTEPSTRLPEALSD